jgi:hypothetical protein
MARFRKRPVEVEALRYDGQNGASVLTWIELWEGHRRGFDLGYALRISTLEGDMRADPGDWIIRGVQGEFYPCKPEIFAATYEPA